MNDGGPAFPHSLKWFDKDTFAKMTDGGMTLRDYFAGKALVGMLASERPDAEMKLADYADDSYRFADAMLKAREA